MSRDPPAMDQSTDKHPEAPSCQPLWPYHLECTHLLCPQKKPFPPTSDVPSKTSSQESQDQPPTTRAPAGGLPGASRTAQECICEAKGLSGELRALGDHGNKLDFLTWSRWDTRPSRLIVALGIPVTRVPLSTDQEPGGKRRGRKLPQRGTKRVSEGRREVMGAESGPGPFSGTFPGSSWGLWHHGPVLTGSSCNCPCEIYFLPAQAGPQLRVNWCCHTLDSSIQTDLQTRNPKLPPCLLTPTTAYHLNVQSRCAHRHLDMRSLG